ncbi:hypothetical protein PR048_015591 [Dryococelus australis]|uniref:Uncharacterized protein n=1 Tax=Dryococelus australis TaxID=614101 RepID=A0ABQ9HHB7_9NEOP|nr:hypothetical protein PR048_015591 [Dryococelus australis]
MRLEWQKKDNLDKHCQSSAHKSKKKSVDSDPQSSKRQASLPEINESVKNGKQEKSEFVMDTVKTFLQANILLHKLDNHSVREYLSNCDEFMWKKVAMIRQKEFGKNLKGKM